MKPVEAMLVVFPNLSGCGILRDALESILNPMTLLGPDMTAFMNQLTTLELINSIKMNFPSRTSIAVERILCEAPNLLHFKAKDMGLKFSCFDLRSDAMAPLWACRNLQTLHIAIQPHDLSRSRDRGPRESRMFYVESLGLLSLCVSVSELLVVRPSSLSSSSLLHKSGVPVLAFAWVSDTVVGLGALPASLLSRVGRVLFCHSLILVIVQRWMIGNFGGRTYGAYGHAELHDLGAKRGSSCGKGNAWAQCNVPTCPMLL